MLEEDIVVTLNIINQLRIINIRVFTAIGQLGIMLICCSNSFLQTKVLFTFIALVWTDFETGQKIMRQVGYCFSCVSSFAPAWFYDEHAFATALNYGVSLLPTNSWKPWCNYVLARIVILVIKKLATSSLEGYEIEMIKIANLFLASLKEFFLSWNSSEEMISPPRKCFYNFEFYEHLIPSDIGKILITMHSSLVFRGKKLAWSWNGCQIW